MTMPDPHLDNASTANILEQLKAPLTLAALSTTIKNKNSETLEFQQCWLKPGLVSSKGITLECFYLLQAALHCINEFYSLMQDKPHRRLVASGKLTSNRIAQQLTILAANKATEPCFDAIKQGFTNQRSSVGLFEENSEQLTEFKPFLITYINSCLDLLAESRNQLFQNKKDNIPFSEARANHTLGVIRKSASDTPSIGLSTTCCLKVGK